MNKEPTPENNGFTVPALVPSTFAEQPSFLELSGPGVLVRLVQFKKISYDGLRLDDSRPDGLFWFEEELLVRVRNRAWSELTSQQVDAKHPFTAPLSSLVTLYMRHYLRDRLAVCKDWANDFDGYVRVRLGSNDKLVALVGSVARQPAYSDRHPQHQAVVANSIWLDGQATQYVIDFRFPANRPYAARIQGPFEF